MAVKKTSVKPKVTPSKVVVKRVYFPKVVEARQALRERAMEIIESYISLVAEAKAAGEFQVAEAALWKLIEHLEGEDGTKLVGQSVDKPKQIEDKKGPQIAIGINLGGLQGPKTLPPSVIDITPENDNN